MASTWGRKSAALTERVLSFLAMLHLPQGLKSPPRPCTPLFIIMHVPPRRRPLLSSIAPETTALVFDVFNLTAHYLCGHSWRKKPRTDRRVPACVSWKIVCVFHISGTSILGRNGGKTRPVCGPVPLLPFQWCHFTIMRRRVNCSISWNGADHHQHCEASPTVVSLLLLYEPLRTSQMFML